MSLSLKPRMSEKAYATSQSLRTYIFDVPKAASKQSIAEAVKAQFNVTVTKVTVTTVSGKAKRMYSKNARRYLQGQRSDIKKAYVTIAEGQNIPIFAAVEEAQEKSDKAKEAVAKAQEKADKKTEKKSEKQEAKPVVNQPARFGGLLRRGSRGGDK